MRKSVVAAVPWLGLLALMGCPAPEPPVLSPVVDLEDAAPYRVEATGTIVIAGRAVPGKVRSDFVVQPDGTIRFLTLAAWMGDADFEVGFAGFEIDSEPVRCARLQNTRPIKGTLDGSAFSVASGEAGVAAFWFKARGADGDCHGDRRHFTIANDGPITGVHDPQANHFSIGFDLTGTFEGQAVSVVLQAQGSYLNRPPVAAIGSGRPSQALADLAEGCPGSEKGDPPVALTATSAGLAWRFRSYSRDPDGEPFAGAGTGKFPRTDIAFEQWSHAAGDAPFVHVGSGPTVGPLVFEVGVEHRLLLTVTDREGARDRVLCRFRVEVAP
jgi:hypothetical protein